MDPKNKKTKIDCGKSKNGEEIYIKNYIQDEDKPNILPYGYSEEYFNIIKHQSNCFGIYKDNQFIGDVSKTAITGFNINVYGDNKNQGIGTLATKAMLNHLFKNIDALAWTIGSTGDDAIRSKRLAQKMGGVEQKLRILPFIITKDAFYEKFPELKQDLGSDISTSLVDCNITEKKESFITPNTANNN